MNWYKRYEIDMKWYRSIEVVSVVVVVVYLSLSLSLYHSYHSYHLLIWSHGRCFKVDGRVNSNTNVYRALCFSGLSASSGTKLRKVLRNHKLRLYRLGIFLYRCTTLPRISTTAL